MNLASLSIVAFCRQCHLFIFKLLVKLFATVSIIAFFLWVTDWPSWNWPV